MIYNYNVVKTAQVCGHAQRADLAMVFLSHYLAVSGYIKSYKGDTLGGVFTPPHQDQLTDTNLMCQVHRGTHTSSIYVRHLPIVCLKPHDFFPGKERNMIA